MKEHYLHRAYRLGFEAVQRGDDHCPFVGKERDWWWAGWGDGISGGVRTAYVAPRRNVTTLAGGR